MDKADVGYVIGKGMLYGASLFFMPIATGISLCAKKVIFFPTKVLTKKNKKFIV